MKKWTTLGREFEWGRPNLDLLRKYPPPHKMLFHTNKFVGTIYFSLSLPHSDAQLDTYKLMFHVQVHCRVYYYMRGRLRGVYSTR